MAVTGCEVRAAGLSSSGRAGRLPEGTLFMCIPVILVSWLGVTYHAGHLA